MVCHGDCLSQKTLNLCLPAPICCQWGKKGNLLESESFPPLYTQIQNPISCGGTSQLQMLRSFLGDFEVSKKGKNCHFELFVGYDLKHCVLLMIRKPLAM